MLLFPKSIYVFCLFQICGHGNISFSPSSLSFNKRLAQRIFVIYILKTYLVFSAVVFISFYMLCMIVVLLIFSI